MTGDDIGRREYLIALGAIAVLAAALRVSFPTADPPWQPAAGVVWHDEGAWVHNARNRALFGQWSLDAWNPMYLAPVFAGLEYLSFSFFGVGLAQARLVSQTAGIVAVVALGLGVAAASSRRAGLMAALFLATSYVTVMFDRAALMEATMVAFLVASWSAYSFASRMPRWGLLAGGAALLAFFTKASAVFYLAALGVEALAAAFRGWRGRSERRGERNELPAGREAAAAWWTLAGLAAGSLLALAVFVVPYWTEVRFYNWQMSVVRKPAYSAGALLDRASWFPIVHDFFTRLWLVTILGATAAVGMAAAWRSRPSSHRLLALWLLLGTMELVLHDVGNERRFVLLVPALAALAGMVLATERRPIPPEMAAPGRTLGVLLAPIVAYGMYVVIGAMVRLPFLYQVRPGVRLAAGLAVVATAALYAAWPRLGGWLVSQRWSTAAAWVVALLAAAGGVGQFLQWSVGRTYKNVAASRALGELLPHGTLVHGKLANGLSLENGIQPIFVGNQFGNYADRLTRHDVPYILTYVEPRVGYEGSIIHDVLAVYPDRRVIASFPVAETPGGNDRVALFEKGPPAVQSSP